MARRGTAGGSAAPVESLPLLQFNFAHLRARTPGKLLETPTGVRPVVQQEQQELMDKLKKVLSGQDDGNQDGPSILEVNGS